MCISVHVRECVAEYVYVSVQTEWCSVSVCECV